MKWGVLFILLFGFLFIIGCELIDRLPIVIDTVEVEVSNMPCVDIPKAAMMWDMSSAQGIDMSCEHACAHEQMKYSGRDSCSGGGMAGNLVCHCE